MNDVAATICPPHHPALGLLKLCRTRWQVRR